MTTAPSPAADCLRQAREAWRARMDRPALHDWARAVLDAVGAPGVADELAGFVRVVPPADPACPCVVCRARAVA